MPDRETDRSEAIEQDVEVLRAKAWRLCEAVAQKYAAGGLHASGHVGWKEQMDAEDEFLAALKDLRTACDGRPTMTDRSEAVAPDWLAARGLAATVTGELIRDVVYRHQQAAGLHYCVPFASCAEPLAAILDVLLNCEHQWSGSLDKHPTCVKCDMAYRAALAAPVAGLPIEETSEGYWDGGGRHHPAAPVAGLDAARLSRAIGGLTERLGIEWWREPIPGIASLIAAEYARLTADRTPETQDAE